ncbi:MAG: TspO/MBR family protein [Beijerinckiaceae bacterium]
MSIAPIDYRLPPLSRRSLIYFAIAMVVVMGAASLGSSITQPHIFGWYTTIRKPGFNPPNWIFPVVWPALFLLMAFGLWRVLRTVHAGSARTRALIAFAIQLACNVAWSAAFFGANSPGLGLIVAVALVISVAAMLLAFLAVDKTAGLAQAPYLAWVTFALVLNATIYMIN